MTEDKTKVTQASRLEVGIMLNTNYKAIPIQVRYFGTVSKTLKQTLNKFCQGLNLSKPRFYL